MFKKIGLLTPLATLMLILVAVNVLLTLGNQSLREAVDERQQVIRQGLQLEALNREILTALATTALRTNDEQLKGLLASQGIRLPANPAVAETSK